MKRRSLALFLAVLMAFGSVLPVFAVEPEATEAVAEEKQETTLTYEDLYVPGAIFTWDASDKTEADVVDFGEGTEIVIAEKGDMQLILTKPADGTAVYGNGYLEVNDRASAHNGATLKLTNVYTNVPAKEGEAYAYTTSATIALLAYQGYATPAGFNQYAYPFASSNGERMWYTYAMQENVNFISAEDTVKAIAWAQDYADAKADASKAATFRTPIREADYNALVAMDEYKDHVFVVNADDEDATNDPSTIYSITGYEADYTAYSYVLNSKGLNAGAYYSGASYPVSKYPNLLKNGVAKTTFNTGTWVTDRDWQASIPVWTAAGEGELVMQTRINTATKLTDKYQYDSAAYANLTEAYAATKTHTTAPGGVNTGSGTSMIFAPGLDARFYGIRIYGRVLTAAELQQNYFADLCKITGVDLAKLEAIGEDGRAMAAAAYSEVSYAEADKAAIEELLDEIKIDMLYADMYVQDDLMYRWDAYGMNAFDGTQTLSMYDKDGRGKILSLASTTAHTDKGGVVIPATHSPIDFTSLIPVDKNGNFSIDELEFEMVLTQTAYTGTGTTGTSPFVYLGPISGIGGQKVTGWADGNKSFGGYAGFYEGNRPTNIGKVTYYFDADGNRVDAAVEGGKSVDVPYLNGSMSAAQVAQQQGWATVNRWFGNWLNESYSVGASMTFTLPENSTAGTMTLALLHDRKITKNNGLEDKTFNNLSYIPGKTNEAGTVIVPANYEEAVKMSTQDVALNSEFKNGGNTFKVGGVDAPAWSVPTLTVAYYAFRVYDRTLTDAERAQNHFADLCNYYKIDNVEAYLSLSATSKAALHAQFDDAADNIQTDAWNTSFEDVTKDQLEDAIDEAARLEKEAIYQDALALMNEGKYAEAKALFESLGDYEDAASKAEECVRLEKEQAEKELKDKAFAAMYVHDGLMYRWDAYGLDSIDGTTLTMTDKDGKGHTLTLGNVSYNSTYKVPETTYPYDFSKLITRTDGVYDEENLEFELVMTQTSFNGTHAASNRPYIFLGPATTTGSGAVLVAYDAEKTPKGFNIPTYGGYAAFYYGLRANSSTSLKSDIYYYDSSNNLVGYLENYYSGGVKTRYRDAEGNIVDSLDTTGLTAVKVPYFMSTVGEQICTQDWASLNRYVGNPVGESYSIGGQIAFDAANYNMSLKLYRDAILNPKGTFGTISYIPGYNASTTGTKIMPKTYEDALAMSKQTAVENTTDYQKDEGIFKIGGVMSNNLKVGYYAFRLYDRALTDAERMQNHFADLCNYYQIDNILAYDALSDELKAAIYTQTQFHEAVTASKLEVSNTSFDDVTKEELEAAINEVVALAEVIDKYQNAIALMGEGKYEEAKALLEVVGDYEDAPAMLAECNVRITLHKYGYVDGYTTFWSAYGANGSSDGVISLGAAPTVSGGTSVYSDGYLRAYGGAKLAVAGAYTAPVNGQTLSYTTELVYAGYDSGVARKGENVTFETRDAPAFATGAYTTFTTAGLRENARFIDNESKAWYHAWTNAYAAASKDEALKAEFWTPVSATDYEALKSAGKNVRDVAGDGKEADPVGAYSQTGYETDWDGFAYVLSSSGLNKARFYPGYNNALKGYVGVANMNIMKNDWNGTVGGWLAQLDYNGTYGPDGGNWTRYDFGTVTTHAWVETLDANVTTAGKNTAQISVFSGDYAVKYGGKTTQTASGTGAFNTNFTIESFEADFYAIRIYPFALTDAQRAQNHFADLASYYGIDNVEAFDSLNDENKAALYDAFASVMVKDTNKAALENAINELALKENYNVKVEDYISFKGYEIRLFDYAGLRSVYSVNKNVVKEGVTLKEVGAIMAIADGRTVDELTVAKNEAGAYVVTGKKMASTAIFDGAWDEDVTDGDGALYTKGDETRFAYTCTFEGNMTDAGKLTTELLFRGYVVLEIGGQDYVLYTNMDAPSYEKISMYDVSKVFAEKGYENVETVKDVLAACEQ